MSRIVLLDTGPLGLATNPKSSQESVECALWVEELAERGAVVRVPEIADYELRRELIRADKAAGINRLDSLIDDVPGRYLPITTEAMRRAAQFWADARRQGVPTAPDLALDADVILAAQAATLGESDVIVATTNPGHLGRFVEADGWRNIKP